MILQVNHLQPLNGNKFLNLKEENKMKLLIDDANIEKIKRIYEYYAIDGVTTNPSILAKNGKNQALFVNWVKDFVFSCEMRFLRLPFLLAYAIM